MPAKIKSVPDLTQYANYDQYLATNPQPKPLSRMSYFRYRRQQLTCAVSTPDKPVPTIAPAQTSKDNIDRLSVNITESGNNGRENETPINVRKNEYLTPEKEQQVTEQAVRTIEKHMVAQWQAAAWWLERVKADKFAKKEGSSALAGAIGIKLVFGSKSSSELKEATITKIE